MASHVTFSAPAWPRPLLRSIKMSANTPDEELRKALSELQEKKLDLNQKVKVSEGQITSLKRDIVKSQLTDKELSQLPSGTNVYKSVGRIFIMESIDEIHKDLQMKETQGQEKIKNIEEKVSYWKKSVQESEENIRDMLSRRAK